MSNLENKNNSDFAYVWLLYGGSAYLPGLQTSIWSLKKTKPIHDLVVMITDDTSFTTINQISKLTNNIHVIPYLKFNRIPLESKHEELYGYNSDILFTKWNALALTKYKKVLLLDCDTIIYENIDSLFNLPTPAAPFNSSFCEPLGSIVNHYTGDSTGYLAHGIKIPIEDIYKSLNYNGTVLIASTVLLEPSMDTYNDFIAFMNKHQPFGFKKCLSGIAEQSLAYFYYTKGVPFYNIHQKYNYFSWNNKFLSFPDTPAVLHIISKPKPWALRSKYQKSSTSITQDLTGLTANLESSEDTLEWTKFYEDFKLNNLVSLKSVLLTDVKAKHNSYNSNNHLPKPDDYEAATQLTYTSQWIDKFHKTYSVINISLDYVPFLKKASQIYNLLGQTLEIYKDQLDNLYHSHDASKINATILLDKTFIRAENVSLKYGIHGISPNNTLESIIESTITAPPYHTPLSSNSLKYYVLPYKDMEPRKEFRVFVYKKKITAISQQHLYKIFNYTNDELNSYANIIINYFNTYITHKVSLDSYVYDIAILPDDSPYFIEINPFGAQYSSGSALFHWVKDESILLSDGASIEFRYTD